MKNKLIVWLILAGLGIAYFGIKTQDPILLGWIFLGLGLFSLFSGIHMIVTRKAAIPTSDSIDAHKERYTGLAAQLYGILFSAFGLGMVLITLGVWLFPESPLLNVETLLNNPVGVGILLAVIGVVILVHGIIRLLAGNAAYVETQLTPFERVAGGLYSVLFGAVVLMISAWIIFSRSSLQALFQYLVSWMG